MPTEELLARAARAALAPVLFDIEPPQAIHDVEVAPEPEAATIRFRTTRACFATVELFRMVTGKVDLDIEKENRERIEIELFGDARLVHRVRFFDLPQERRFWFRISVPGAGPGTALGQKKVRHRGWFSTLRRTATCAIGTIKVLSDSDSESAGELTFEVAAYDAARGDGRLDFALSGEHGVESGGRIRDPFGKVLDLGRAPDRVAVHVWGEDDDENDFVSFLVAPWEGLNLRGRLPPERRPAVRGPSSDRIRDSNDLEVVASLPVGVGRHTVPISGMTPIAVLAFEIAGSIDCTVRDVLGQPRPPAVTKLRPSLLGLAEGRAVGSTTKAGGLLLTLGEAGELLWRVPGDRAAGWRELAGPAFDHVGLIAREGAAPLLLGVDREGRLHLASLDRAPPEAPAWRETGLVQAAEARRGPAVAATREGLLLAFRDRRGRLLLARPEDGHDTVRVLAEEPGEDPVLGQEEGGRAWIACRARSGRVLAGPVEAGALRPVEGEVAELLGIGGTAETGPVLVALDREGRVLARALEGDAGWVALGTLQAVVEPESLEPPPVETAEAAP